jgi:1,4-alpha-glucan branching enzyme
MRERVSVVGDFNVWDGRRHPMRRRGAPACGRSSCARHGEGAVYKYEIRGPTAALLPLKADPVGFGAEHPPRNGSVVRDIAGYGWRDADWMASRAARNRRRADLDLRGASGVVAPRADGARMLSYLERPISWWITPPTWASPISS